MATDTYFEVRQVRFGVLMLASFRHQWQAEKYIEILPCHQFTGQPTIAEVCSRHGRRCANLSGWSTLKKAKEASDAGE